MRETLRESVLVMIEENNGILTEESTRKPSLETPVPDSTPSDLEKHFTKAEF